MLSETKTSRLFIFYCLHVICRYMESWSPSRRVGFQNFSFLKSNDVLDAVLGTDPGEQRCFKFLIRQFVSLNKTKIICSMTDRKLSLPVVSVVWRSHQWLVATQTFQTYFRCSRQYNHRCKYTWFKWKRLVKSYLMDQQIYLYRSVTKVILWNNKFICINRWQVCVFSKFRWERDPWSGWFYLE